MLNLDTVVIKEGGEQNRKLSGRKDILKKNILSCSQYHTHKNKNKTRNT